MILLKKIISKSGTILERIFQLLDRVTPDVGRKRLISVNYFIKQLFDILGVEYKFTPLTQSKNTLKYYEDWWERVNRLVSQTGSKRNPLLLIEREMLGVTFVAILSAILRDTYAVSVGRERNFLAYCFSNLVTNGAKSTIVSSKTATSFRKSSLLKVPPRNEVLNPSNTLS